ncbi:MAG: hypothetical protein JWM11_1388 [Planctomycetaceae bacterium]|nr:hypothetical protein [Planctomycetaceae bacterium]
MQQEFGVKTVIRLTAWFLALVSAVSGTGLPAVSAADPVVKLVKQDNAIAVTINGQEFTTYHTDPKWPKPFFSPVKTPSGTILTRPVHAVATKEHDHVHHKGIWVAIDEVNGNQHWAEKAIIKNVSVELVKPEGNPAEMRVINHWLGKDGEPVVIETTGIQIFANRLLAYDIQFTAGKSKVHWGDTKEGLFGIRVADSVREKQSTPDKPAGKIVDANGRKTMKECWGLSSNWVDYSGLVDGKVEGVAIFDNPTNFRRSRYHVRDYGLFTISPFGQKAYTNGQMPADELEQEPGTSFHLKYGIYIHSGDSEQADVAKTYAEYVEKTKGTVSK